MGKSHFILNKYEIKKLENLRHRAKEEKDHNLDRRARAILLIGRDGKTRPQAAEMCEAGLRTIYDWQEYYRLSGIKGLLMLKKPGKQGKLKKSQLKKLSELIIAGPEAAGYESGMWTGPLVTALIKREFNIEFCVHWVRIILHKLGFSIQFPKKKLAKAELKKQEKWINKTLPKIENEVESSGGVLVYEDEAIFRQSGTVNKTWAPVGIGMEVKSEPGRASLKTFGAINVTSGDEPRWHFRFAKIFNGNTFIGFLEQLTRRYPEQKVHLVLDNIPYHKSPQVREWFALHKKKIKPFYLPAYSPELNATEYVWRATKRKATHNIYFPRKRDLWFKLFRRFNRYQGNPKSLRDTVKWFASKHVSK